MAQTTNAISFKNVKIELSTNGTVWTDASGFSNKVEVGGGERAYGEFFTADGDTPILTVGKRSSFEITANVVYTETASEPWDIIYTAYTNASALYLRWSPKGGSSTQLRFVTGIGYVLSPIHPGGDASTPDVVTVEFTLRCLTITKETIA